MNRKNIYKKLQSESSQQSFKLNLRNTQCIGYIMATYVNHVGYMIYISSLNFVNL